MRELPRLHDAESHGRVVDPLPTLPVRRSDELDGALVGDRQSGMPTIPASFPDLLVLEGRDRASRGSGRISVAVAARTDHDNAYEAELNGRRRCKSRRTFARRRRRGGYGRRENKLRHCRRECDYGASTPSICKTHRVTPSELIHPA